MTEIQREIEIVKLEDKKQFLGMTNVAQLTYDEQVHSRAKHRLDCSRIDEQIRDLRACKVTI